MSSVVGTSQRKGANATLALIFLGLFAALQGADPNIASTALLSAGKDLQFGAATALAASVSTLALAATVITTGMVADRLGRKKIILASMLLLVIGDGLVSISTSAEVFIAGRALAGVALGGVYGASFAYVKYFGERTKGGIAAALGTFSAGLGLFALLVTFAGSAAVGLGWREAFLVIPILSIVSFVIALFILPPDQKSDQLDKPWDVVGQVLLGLAVVGTLYGISHAADSPTSVLTIGPVVLGIVLFVLFYFRERSHSEKRFFPIGLLKKPLFLAAIGVGFLYNFSTGFGLLSFSNLFQYQLGLKGIQLSLAQLPYLLLAIPTVLVVGKLISKNIVTRQMSALIGSFVAAAGGVMFAMTALGAPKSVIDYLPSLVVLGIAAAIPAVAYGGLILEEADPEHYGVVSSSRSTIGQFWYSLGLASSTIVIDGITRAYVVNKLGASAESQLNSWSASGAKPTDASVLPTAIEGFVQGFAALTIGYAVVMLIVGFVVLFLGNKADKHKALETAT